ncbi:hypothetical protein Tco_0374308 [Tanacetum coccineum]
MSPALTVGKAKEVKNFRAQEVKERLVSASSEVALIDETRERFNEEMLFDVQVDLQGEEVVAEKEVAKKEGSVADLVTTAGKVAEEQAELEKERTAHQEASREVVIEELVSTSSMIVLMGISCKIIKLKKQEQFSIKEKSECFCDKTKEVLKEHEMRLNLIKSRSSMIDEHVEAEKDDQEEAEMKRHIEIVKDDEVAIDAIPLATNPLVIVEYKIDKDGRIRYFKLIRANGISKRYSSMIKMLQDID